MGISTAATFLQRVLSQQADYAGLVVDGVVGQGTIAALTAFLHKRGTQGEQVLLKALNSLQGARYIELAEHRSLNEAFTFGWLANRV